MHTLRKFDFYIMRRMIYLFVIVGGLMTIFFPFVVSADVLGNEIEDVYATITENAIDTNKILGDALSFSKISPFDVLANAGGAGVVIGNASKSAALAIAVMLLMIDFFRKSVQFEWSSRWENILLFLVKIIVIKQVVQNADVIIGYIYAGFDSITAGATAAGVNFLDTTDANIYTKMVKVSELEQMSKGWWEYFYNKGAGDTTELVSYRISMNVVQMFYPNAAASGFNLNDNPFVNPLEGRNFFPTLELLFMQPYFLIMKACAYIVFVVAVGRTFELAVYTMFAPLPLATFASETSSDVARNFLKNYIAVVLQVGVIIGMFAVYQGLTIYLAAHYSSSKILMILALISLAAGVFKSGSWAKHVCGVG